MSKVKFALTPNRQLYVDDKKIEKVIGFSVKGTADDNFLEVTLQFVVDQADITFDSEFEGSH